MKGIILAGGSGTRLYPLTIAISKQIMPVYDKPMIYYPLSTLMQAGIREILIISTPHDISNFQKLLWNGDQIWCHFEYMIQPSPDGLAQAFLLWEQFIWNDKVALILWDNIFYGAGMGELLTNHTDPDGGVVFAYHVVDPNRYGVVEFDDHHKVVSIEEKPLQPKSNYAIPGLYFYDNTVIQIAKQITPSARWELEITDINIAYLHQNKLTVGILDKGTARLDTGTFASLMQAGQFVQVIEERQWLKIWCIEEIAWKSHWIDNAQLQLLADKYMKSGYGQYLSWLMK